VNDPTVLVRRLRMLPTATEAVVTYARVRIRLRRRGAAATAALIPAARARATAGAVDEARIERVAERVLQHLPGDSRCLTRSLVVASMLSRRGVGARVVIGVKPAPDFTAHAWVETPRSKAVDHPNGYTRIAEL
jgi:hypothetical protein